MSIETELRDKLLADGTVSGLVGTRIYPVVLPQGVTYPAIAYSRVSGERLHHLGGASGRGLPRISFSMWGRTYTEAYSVADAVRHVLDGFNGLLTTIKASVLIENEMDDYDDTVQKHRVNQDYFANHRET